MRQPTTDEVAYGLSDNEGKSTSLMRRADSELVAYKDSLIVIAVVLPSYRRISCCE